LKDSRGIRIADECNIKTNSGQFRANFGFSAGFLELWYPVGYGKQPIYTIEIEVIDEVNKHIK
jgi:beta-mannosidase